jgi:wobble nucleotide-excising tRNase
LYATFKTEIANDCYEVTTEDAAKIKELSTADKAVNAQVCKEDETTKELAAAMRN